MARSLNLPGLVIIIGGLQLKISLAFLPKGAKPGESYTCQARNVVSVGTCNTIQGTVGMSADIVVHRT